MRVASLANVVAVAVAVVAGAGCAKKAPVQVAPIEMPALVPPPPPPRVVADYPEEAPPAEEPATPEPPPPTRPTPRPPARPAPPAPEAPAPEPPKTPAPPLTLPPASGNQAQTEASIRGLLAKATRDLEKVNAAALNADGKTQFETARRFVQQAEEALKTRNLVYAGKLADKAATMAAVLVR